MLPGLNGRIVMSNGFRRFGSCFVLAVAFVVTPLATARAGASQTLKTLEPGKLKVCLYAGFAPFASKDKDGNWQGWDVDYLKAFAQASNLHFEVIAVQAFDGIWLEPGLGHCDIAGTGISDIQDRRKATGQAGEWSNTYYHVLRAFLVQTTDFPKLAKVDDLSGKKTIVTKGSTANSDLCYRMQGRNIHPCKKADGDHPCVFPGLDHFKEHQRAQDKSCVYIEYPWMNDEKNAALDVAQGRDRDQDPGPPFTYGGGYGSVQSLVCDCQTSLGASQALVTVWSHCNMASGGKAYAEPFSFVVRAADTGLAHALNCYINSQHYEGTPIPGIACPSPPWTPAPDKACS
jgi:hypothetical protein